VIAAVDPLGNRTTVAYDALNRPYQTTDALGPYGQNIEPNCK
jgi:YD repeat-containing protein